MGDTESVDSASVRYLITLVHGIFATNAPWMTPESTLSTTLRDRLGEGVKLVAFNPGAVPLMHSVVYENPRVLAFVSDWIAEGNGRHASRVIYTEASPSTTPRSIASHPSERFTAHTVHPTGSRLHATPHLGHRGRLARRGTPPTQHTPASTRRVAHGVRPSHTPPAAMRIPTPDGWSSRRMTA